MDISSLSSSEFLLYGGIAMMAAAVILGVASAVVLHITGKRLRDRLENEYGKKLH